MAAAGWRVAAALGLRERSRDRGERRARSPRPDGARQRPLPLRAQAGRRLREGVGRERRPPPPRALLALGRRWAKTSRPLWLGSATFDASVGLSHRTGQITHHIAPDIDAERDALLRGLAAADELVREYQVTGVGEMLWGRNGGGDRYFTDGELWVGTISPGNAKAREPARGPRGVAPGRAEEPGSSRVSGRCSTESTRPSAGESVREIALELPERALQRRQPARCGAARAQPSLHARVRARVLHLDRAHRLELRLQQLREAGRRARVWAERATWISSR